MGLVAQARLSVQGSSERVLVVDAANVIGSRPTGWWKDRAGAARAFVDDLRAAAGAGRLDGPIVAVLEGKARAGVSSGTAEGVTVVHATGSGDDALVDVVRDAATEGSESVVLVTADRELRRRAEAVGAAVVGPSWLWERLS